MRIKVILLFCIVIVLGGCAAVNNNDMIKSLPGTVPTVYDTPYSPQLRCIGNTVKRMHKHKYVIAVGPIEDKTGKFSVNSGNEVTQGAEFMAVSAIGKTNAFEQVDRLNLNIINSEINYTNQFLLRDADSSNNFKKGYGEVRKLDFGSLSGSDYILIGAITELNYLVDSQVAEVSIGGFGGGWRHFWIDLGVDLRVVDTKTSRIVKTISFKKQIYGYENKLGVFKIFGATLVDFNIGRKRQEPISFAVRTVIEDAVLEMATYLYNLPKDSSCEK
jgi:curli production assembly/transport component CsgG/holdfast attachment protein HfaB